MTRHGTAFVSVWLGVEALLLLAIVFWLEPASADLVPAPDSVPWRVGEERTVWLDTNLRNVELRVARIDLGLGDIARLEQGKAATIGRSTGCLDSEVSSIALDEIEATGATAIFTVDYGSRAGGEMLAVHHRIYEAGQAPGEGVAATVDLTVPASGELTASADYTGLNTGVRHYVEASTFEHFPHEATAVVSFVPEDGGVFVVTVVERLPGREFHLAVGTGIGLVGCHEGEDVLVSLWSDQGGQLRSYLVDVLPAAPAAAAPPAFAGGHAVHRVAVADAASRSLYFDGGEAVATVTATGGTAPLSYSLAPAGDSLDFVFFDINGSTGAVTVSTGGADDHAGLELDRTYTFEVHVEDANGLSDETNVAVQVVRP